MAASFVIESFQEADKVTGESYVCTKVQGVPRADEWIPLRLLPSEASVAKSVWCNNVTYSSFVKKLMTLHFPFMIGCSGLSLCSPCWFPGSPRNLWLCAPVCAVWGQGRGKCAQECVHECGSEGYPRPFTGAGTTHPRILGVRAELGLAVCGLLTFLGLCMKSLQLFLDLWMKISVLSPWRLWATVMHCLHYLQRDSLHPCPRFVSWDEWLRLHSVFLKRYNLVYNVLTLSN